MASALCEFYRVPSPRTTATSQIAVCLRTSMRSRGITLSGPEVEDMARSLTTSLESAGFLLDEWCSGEAHVYLRSDSEYICMQAGRFETIEAQVHIRPEVKRP